MKYIIRSLIAGIIVMVGLVINESRSDVNVECDYTKLEVPQVGVSGLRNTTWGMSTAEVYNVEGATLRSKTSDMLIYNYVLSGRDALLIYNFHLDQLCIAAYIMEDTRLDGSIRNYNFLKKTLTKRYGTPKTNEAIWYDDKFKRNLGLFEYAVGTGSLVYRSTWETKDDRIYLILKGSNLKTCCNIVYLSKALQYLLDEKEETNLNFNF